MPDDLNLPDLPKAPEKKPFDPRAPLSLDMEHLKASVRTLDDRKQGWKTPQDCAHCRNNLAFVLRFHGTLHNNRWRPGDLIRGVGKVTETCECGYQVFKSIIFPGVDLGGADNE